MSMSAVEWKNLGEVMQIVRGASPRPINNYLTTDIDGVNWIKIGDVSVSEKYITKTKEKITKEGASRSRYLKPGDFILSNSMSFGRPYILKTDGCIHDGWIAMSNFNEYLISGYLYEVLSSNEVQQYWKMKANNGGAMTNLNSDIVRETLIPIPSLAKQQEIVSHLDTFTSLISNLESELDMRRKQYEHYRNQLLDFEGVEGVEWKTLGDICDLKNGYTPSTKNPDFWDNGHLPWFTLEDIRKNGNILYDAIKHITPLGIKRNGLFPKDSIIVSTTATIGEYALVCVDFMCNQQITCISISEACKNLVLVKYLYHLGYKIGDWCRNNVNGGGGLSIVSTSKLKQYSFPIPSLAKQREIVSKLDTFENLIQSLEQEIKLRKQQYEYYREKLLTFE